MIHFLFLSSFDLAVATKEEKRPMPQTTNAHHSLRRVSAK